MNTPVTPWDILPRPQDVVFDILKKALKFLLSRLVVKVRVSSIGIGSKIAARLSYGTTFLVSTNYRNVSNHASDVPQRVGGGTCVKFISTALSISSWSAVGLFFSHRYGFFVWTYEQDDREKVNFMYYLRGTFRIKLLFSDVEADYATETKKAAKNLSVDQTDEVSSLINHVTEWHSARSWFMEKGIKQRLGIFLHGPPGSGKSGMADRIASCLKMPKLNWTLKAELFVPTTADVVYVIDDIDTVFNGRTCLLTNAQWTFGDFLSAVDNLPDGCVLVITANDASKVDPAIAHLSEDGKVSRPGRIDRVVYVGPMSAQARVQLAGSILSEWPSQVEKCVQDGEGETVAQFKERCVTIAIKLYWESRRSGLTQE